MALKAEAASRPPYVESDPFQDPHGMKAPAVMNNISSDSISVLLADSLAGVQELVRRLGSAGDKQSGPVPEAVETAPCKLDHVPSTLDLCWRLRAAVMDAHEEMSRIERAL